MILIIEAGGTKSNLALVNENGVQATFVEAGLQLARESLEDIKRKIERWVDLFQHRVNAIWVFAAGAGTNEKTNQLRIIISNIFQCNSVFIESDLLGACYAAAGDESGIVGIMGTGSNSCYYNGESVQHQVAPGGFILGDEGSGAHLGKMFLLDFLRNQVPETIKLNAMDKLGLNSTTIVQQLYGSSIRESANYCAINGGFVLDNLEHEYCRGLAQRSIHEFLLIIEKNYLVYSQNIYMVGSVAYLLHDIIQRETGRRNMNLVKIIQHPINELSLFLARKKFS